MSFTEREKKILQLSSQGLSDYKIAKILKVTPPTITKSHKTARRKLANALADVKWAASMGIDVERNDFDFEDGG